MKKIHFIGIGGIGMSALAEICLARGCVVTGSDLRLNNLTDELSKNGAIIRQGHSRDNVSEEMDVIVRSTCIRDDNPELQRAREFKKNIISRGQLLREVINEFPSSVAVTGTHGKTTTSALLAHIAEHCGRNATLLVGGEVESLGSNAKLGGGELVIAEVDESDGYFRNIDSTCAVVTNIEREHM